MQKRDPFTDMLLGASELAPTALGAAGMGIGGVLGVTGGPLAPLTVPGAAAIGAAAGGAVGTGLKLWGDSVEADMANKQQDELQAQHDSAYTRQEKEMKKLARDQAYLSLLSQFL